MPTNPEDTNKIELSENLKKVLEASTSLAEKQLILEKPKGYCPKHGKVGWARMVLYDHDPTAFSEPSVVSEHCVYCLSRIFTALVGTLKYDDEPQQCTPQEIKKQGG